MTSKETTVPPDDGRTEPKPDSLPVICPKCGKPTYRCECNQTTDLVATLRDPNWTHPPRWLLLKAADEIERLRCRGNDPYCPCQDGLACHYVDLPASPAMKPKESAKDEPSDHND